MATPAKINFKVYQGSTFLEVLRWESALKAYRNITNITKSAPVVITSAAHAIPVAPLPAAVISQASHDMGRPPTNVTSKVDPNDITLIGGRSRSHTPPFLLTYEI